MSIIWLHPSAQRWQNRDLNRLISAVQRQLNVAVQKVHPTESHLAHICSGKKLVILHNCLDSIEMVTLRYIVTLLQSWKIKILLIDSRNVNGVDSFIDTNNRQQYHKGNIVAIVEGLME